MLNINTEFSRFINDIYIEGKINHKGLITEYFEIVIYSPNNYIACKCSFFETNNTIPNTNLEGIYKLFINAIDSVQNYSIKWENYQKDLSIVVVYQNEIFTFEQIFNFTPIDNSIPQLKYQLFQSNQQINQLKQNIISIETYSKLTENLNNLSIELNNLKKQVNQKKISIEYA